MLYLLVIHCFICFNFIKATDKPVQCKKIRIRKEVNDLTQYETNVLTYAFKKAITKGTKGKKLEDIASYHGAPFNVCYGGIGVCNRWKIVNSYEKCSFWRPRKTAGCCPHPDGQSFIDFIIWHRLYVGMSNIIHDNIILSM